MKPRSPKPRHPVTGKSVERLSISISAEDKAGLERIAVEKRVSLAWVIRDAVMRYLEADGKNTPSTGKTGG